MFSASLAGILFITRSLTAASPIVDLGLLRNRTFAMAAIFRCVVGFGLFASIYALPLFLTRVSDFDARLIGDAVFVAGCSQILGAPIVAYLSTKVDARYLMAFGFATFSLGMWMSVPLTSEWMGPQFFWPQIVRGFSLLFCLVPATNLALGSLPTKDLKAGSALFNTTTNIGGAIGIATVNTMLNDRTNYHWDHIVQRLQVGDPHVIAWLRHAADFLGATLPGESLSHLRAASHLAQTVRREAITLAFSDIFFLMAVLFLVGMCFVPLLKKPTGYSGNSGGGAH